MATWLAPKKAANYIKEHNPETMIGEKQFVTSLSKVFLA